MISLSINGRRIDLDEATTLLDAARQAGIHIPTLCHSPNLPSHAVCRMCLVEVDGHDTPQPACCTPAQDGDVVETRSEALQAFRQANAEWILARHPNDCMRCEVNGDCRLQRLVSENQWQERWPEVAPGSPAHPEHISTDHTSPSIWRDL